VVVAFTRYCYCQYCMMSSIHTGGRKGSRIVQSRVNPQSQRHCTSLACTQRNRSHTNTQQEQHNTRHDKTTPHKHNTRHDKDNTTNDHMKNHHPGLTTIEGGAATVRITSHTRVGGRAEVSVGGRVEVRRALGHARVRRAPAGPLRTRQKGVWTV